MESICSPGLPGVAPGATMAAAFHIAMPQPPRKPPLIPIMQRKTKRASVSLPYGVMEELTRTADNQGCSLSNVIAFLLEARLREMQGDPRYQTR